MSSSNGATTKSSYSQAAQQRAFPTREQAIVLDSVNGISVQEYVIQIGKIIGPKNIRFVSRISNNRVILYLNSKDTVDKLTDKKTKVNIGSNILEIRPLVSKHKRIILSNVCPIIPHDIILSELNKYEIIPKSPISFIRAGMNDPGFAHILSFRRQTYIEPEDIDKVPSYLKINYDGTDYWIYFSTHKVSCFICKEEGHVARFCKSLEATLPQQKQDSEHSGIDEGNTTDQKNQTVADTSTPNIIDQSKDNEVPHNPSLLTEIMSPPAIHASKRRASHSLSSGSSLKEPVDIIKESPTTKHHNKPRKFKTAEQSNEITKNYILEDIITEIEPAKDVIESEKNTHLLSFNQVAEFLLNTYNNKKIPETAQTYTSNTPALIELLKDILGYIVESRLKNRIKRIIKRLETSDLADSSSDASSIIIDE